MIQTVIDSANGERQRDKDKLRVSKSEDLDLQLHSSLFMWSISQLKDRIVTVKKLSILTIWNQVCRMLNYTLIRTLFTRYLCLPQPRPCFPNANLARFTSLQWFSIGDVWSALMRCTVCLLHTHTNTHAHSEIHTKIHAYIHRGGEWVLSDHEGWRSVLDSLNIVENFDMWANVCSLSLSPSLWYALNGLL